MADRNARGGGSASELPRHSLKEVAARLGVPPSLLRGWERRYGVVVPDRDPSGHRLYSDRQVSELEWLLHRVRMGVRPREAHKELEESRLPHVGAPVVEPHPPQPGTPAFRLHRWATREPLAAGVLGQLRESTGLASTFLVVKFEHPEAGPAGAIVVLQSPLDPSQIRARRRLVSTIPFADLGDYPERWARGETVLVHVEDMPPPLRLRYTAVPVAWSLNMPLLLGGELLGLVGATSEKDRPRHDQVLMVQAARDLILAEFQVAEARQAYESGVLRQSRSLWDQP